MNIELTQEEKKILQDFKWSPVYKLLVRIEENEMNKITQIIMANTDFNNKDHIRILEKNQDYCKARKDFLQNIDKHTKWIYTPWI